MSFGDLEAIGKSALKIYRDSEHDEPTSNLLQARQDLELVTGLTTETLR
jgi:hypothetical protein